MNHDGYMAHVRTWLADQPIAVSYIDEAVRAFQGGCMKAAAVMAGAAVESLVLSIRDAMVAQYRPPSSVPAVLASDKVKTVRDSLASEFERRKPAFPRDLRERFDGFWQSGSDLFRLARNDAGHPKAPSPLTEEQVHASLLLFPEWARLAADLKAWTDTNYSA